jgi:DNA ligase-1
MRTFAETAEKIAATTKKLEKTALLAEYFKSVAIQEAAVAAVFLSGRPFPAWEETTLQVGGRLLWSVVEELSGKSDSELTAAYREYGDLGAVAGAVLPGDTKEQWGDGRPRPSDAERSLSPAEIQVTFREIAAARGPVAKGVLVRKLLSEITPVEAKYVVKILTGDLRIGLKESLVEEAIAKAFDETLKDVQRANMLVGDIGETLRLAAEDRLAEAKMRLFHPIGFMLASPAESAEDALSYFQNAWVEDKYDGIRAQAHCSGDAVRFFSRTRDEITESFPELPDALAGLPQDVILDGEIVAWSYLADSEILDPEELGMRPSSPASSQAKGTGRALPFSALQQRLGRKKVSETMMRDVPVAYLIFDVLYAGGELVIDRPLRERAEILDGILKSLNHREHGVTQRKTVQGGLGPQGQLSFAAASEDEGSSPSTDFSLPGEAQRRGDQRPAAQIIRAPVFEASSPVELNRLFDAAQARGNEGLMIKDPESPYTPGRRGKSWLKLKRELATLDVVVTAVEFGHGKRIGVLSDYTFAVRAGDRLLNIGKAYSGLTDVEIAEMTKWFLEHTIEDQGFRRTVEPKIVLEVAFNNIMKSDRHSSGYALRFPRIVRLRPDKLPEEADTIETVKEIFAKQNG